MDLKKTAALVSNAPGVLTEATEGSSSKGGVSINNLPVEGETDKAISKRVTRKCDIRLVPILAMLYLTAFLDRTNIGNAKVLGLEKELGMPSNGYNTALWVFYLSFVLLEVPSNLILTWSKIPPNWWLGISMTLLGIVTMCQGFASSPGALYACRFIMGIFEGGLAPGAALLMGQYYRKSEYSARYSCFTIGALMGSAFLAYAINFMDGIHGISSWRWIFILEGILSTCVACFAFFIVPNFPAESTFLNPEEKEFLLRRLEAERGKEKTSIKDIQWLPIFLDWKVWLNILVYFGADMSAASTAGFSPTILTQLGWTANEANVHNIPIWIVGATCSLTFSIIAGKTGRRFPFIMFGWACCLCGWSIQLAQVNPPAVRYFGLFLFAAGAFIQMPLLVSWLNVNMTGRTAKAVAVALQVGFGNSCNFVSSNVFITAESPKYRTAFSTGVGLTVMGGMAACANAALLWNENRKADKRESEGLSDEVFNMPDGTRFRYTI